MRTSRDTITRAWDRTAKTQLWQNCSASMLFILKRRSDLSLAQDALPECFQIALVQLRSGCIGKVGYRRSVRPTPTRAIEPPPFNASKEILHVD